MRTITHRQLRNNSSAVLRDVANGETVTVTNHGKVAAVLVPPGSTPDLACVRPATRRVGFSEMTRTSHTTSTATALADLRGDR